MSPKLKSLLARAILLGGAAFVATYAARSLPREQSLAIRLSGHDIKRIEGVVTRAGDDEPTAGFSRVFPEKSPSLLHQHFKAASGTYIVVITLMENVTGDAGPKLTETTFERQVSLVGGEVIVSPD